MEQLFYVVVGWLLGLLGPGIVERIQRSYRKEDFMKTLATELRELQLCMALVAFDLERHLSSLSADTLDLVGQVLRDYSGPEEAPESLALARELLSLPAEERRARLAAPQRLSSAPRMRRYYMPFLESQVPNLSICPLDFQQRAMQVSADLRIYNDLVDEATSAFEKTFDASITGANRDIVRANLRTTFSSLLMRSLRIVREVDQLLAKHEL